ncbi:LacI family DNA-binding transcriptional regulator [Nonomuraea soli]|uniref:DNA-binding LacI/PurR family transcriptional regulator n=1 Tax=Nonomuraea soli TaxID=1032476 RepID=A0A7W0CE79_9ACTN|nr:LacI family DNA-binding transcriptional regulator [Nonomuraea soli]MBA2889397.1 DNA-binding LacI/PurR family transcriptional regulator [Nonomuraea soli]
MTRRPRQRDIAKLAGVSQTTVSLVLNGKTAELGINRETEQKILDAIRELGYVPNVTARALRGGRNGLLGVHTFEPLFPTGRESYYDEFMIGIEQQAIRSGQDLVLFTSMHQGGDPSVFRGGQNRLRIADGAIILGFEQHDDELERLAAEGFPFVFIGRRERAAALMPYVTADYAPAMAQLVAMLHEHGHRRVAYLGLADRAEPRVERRESFAAACAELGLTVTGESFAGHGELDRAWLDGLLARETTVLLVESTEQLEEVAALGVDIPGRLSAVGLDSINESTPVTHDWTHLVVARRAMGARAVELLLEVLDGRRDLHYHERLPCGFAPGATLNRIS